MFNYFKTRGSPERASRQSFAKSEAGNVAMLFGLMAFTTFTMMGAAIDMGRWLQARRVTVDAMEAATLAGLRNYQETKDAKAAQDIALLNYQANVRQRQGVTQDNVSFKLENSGNSITMTAQGNANYNTLFLAVLPNQLNLTQLPMLKKDNSEHPISKLAVGQNSGTSLEISMMLDITGSMDSTDSAGKKKIASLIESAQKLIDIVVWDDQSKYTSKVALVPFSEAINLGNTRTTAARGSKASSITSNNAAGKSTTWKLVPNCVTERTGTDRYTDTSYVTAPVGAMYTTDGKCDTPNVVMPLDSDKTVLKNAIKSYVAAGPTAGQMGTAWAWYTLSPNFNGLWGNSKYNARPYSDLTVLNDKGQPVLKKIAVLMTDGDYNTQYCNGAYDKNASNYSTSERINCTSPNGTASAQALALCDAMKKKGITVYTIGFMVSTAAKNLLTTCATDTGKYYDASNGTQLMQAFTDIAYNLVPPFVAH